MEESKDAAAQPAAKTKKSSKKKTDKLDEQKVLEAKKKINELLKGTGLEEPDDDSVLVSPDEYSTLAKSQETKAASWMEGQVEALSKQVEILESENLKLRNQVQFMNTNGATAQFSDDNSEKVKIIEMFKHFQDVYVGRKKGTPYSRVALSYPQTAEGVLDVMQAMFPYLQEYRFYKHWG